MARADGVDATAPDDSGRHHPTGKKYSDARTPEEKWEWARESTEYLTAKAEAAEPGPVKVNVQGLGNKTGWWGEDKTVPGAEWLEDGVGDADVGDAPEFIEFREADGSVGFASVVAPDAGAGHGDWENDGWAEDWSQPRQCDLRAKIARPQTRARAPKTPRTPRARVQRRERGTPTRGDPDSSEPPLPDLGRLAAEIARVRGPALGPDAQLEWDLTHGVGSAKGFWRLVRFDAEHEWDRLENERELERTREAQRKLEREARARLLSPPPPGRLTLSAALERLERVRKTPKGWTALCPAHEDRTPSLMVSESDARPGEPVFHCFAGCDWSTVRDALR